MKLIILMLIKIYQKFSGLGLPRCRFTPSCSDYAYDAIECHGILRGMWLIAKRLIRCHPFCIGGYDPVPLKGNICKKIL